jgi:exodeoxyribonuclease III
VSGGKFEYKLRWFECLHDYAAELLELEVPVVLAGDYNVMPTDLDVYKLESWVDDALFRVEVRDAFKTVVEQGWTDALRSLHPDERIYTFWDYFRNAYARDAGLRIDHSCCVRKPQAGWPRQKSTSTSEDGSTRTTTRRYGSSSPMNR